MTARQIGLYLLSLTIGVTLWITLWVFAPFTGVRPAPLITAHRTAYRHAFGDVRERRTPKEETP